MEEIAQVYARSLFEVADEHDKLDAVREQLGELADAIGDSRELQTFFFSRTSRPTRRRRASTRPSRGWTRPCAASSACCWRTTACR